MLGSLPAPQHFPQSQLPHSHPAPLCSHSRPSCPYPPGQGGDLSSGGSRLGGTGLGSSMIKDGGSGGGSVVRLRAWAAGRRPQLCRSAGVAGPHGPVPHPRVSPGSPTLFRRCRNTARAGGKSCSLRAARFRPSCGQRPRSPCPRMLLSPRARVVPLQKQAGWYWQDAGPPGQLRPVCVSLGIEPGRCLSRVPLGALQPFPCVPPASPPPELPESPEQFS